MCNRLSSSFHLPAVWRWVGDRADREDQRSQRTNERWARVRREHKAAFYFNTRKHARKRTLASTRQ